MPTKVEKQMERDRKLDLILKELAELKKIVEELQDARKSSKSVKKSN